MIIGSGDIASALPDRDDLLFFASGVSNSKETRQSEFKREEDLLCRQPEEAHLVYFSSLAIFYSDTLYTRHKRLMELLVKGLFPLHTIIRIGNISWGTNPHTLINYLKAHPEAELKDEYRYIVDRSEFLHWIGLIPNFSCEMNVPGTIMKVQEIYNVFCRG